VLAGKAGDPVTGGKQYLVMRDEKLGRLKLNALVTEAMTFSKAGKCNVRFFATLEEASSSIVANEDGGFRRVLNHDKVTATNVVLNLKVPQDRIDDTLEALEKAKK
jgi:hypothetical protein